MTEEGRCVSNVNTEYEFIRFHGDACRFRTLQTLASLAQAAEVCRRAAHKMAQIETQLIHRSGRQEGEVEEMEQLQRPHLTV